jgi:hypothetical protein
MNLKNAVLNLRVIDAAWRLPVNRLVSHRAVNEQRAVCLDDQHAFTWFELRLCSSNITYRTSSHDDQKFMLIEGFFNDSA